VSNNNFEQFCINLANEQLQSFFNQHIFQQELEEYKREGVDGATVSYVDNSAILDTYLGRPVGLLTLLDEESHFPRATDDSLVEKFNKTFVDSVVYEATPSQDPSFRLLHYAGSVEYYAVGFLDKNRDSLAPAVLDCLQESGLSVVAETFQGSLSTTGQVVPSRARWGANRSRPTESSAKSQNNTYKRGLTVSGQFRNSLQMLVMNMSAGYPHFVRCIKPNRAKHSNKLEEDFVLAQLKYTGT
jgi:myosin heavy subunit